jgi:hypothetical protein
MLESREEGWSSDTDALRDQLKLTEVVFETKASPHKTATTRCGAVKERTIRVPVLIRRDECITFFGKVSAASETTCAH